MSAAVTEVLKNSFAEKAGIKPGDIILEINKAALRDIIDFQIAVEEPELEILVERNGKKNRINLQKNRNKQIGIRFASSIFDDLRRCQNNCIFCFLDQLPNGLRQSLYVKDDDFRLSFLYGNFITLTNLNEEDVKRIVRQRLSPLYVSLHSVERELRKSMLRAKEDEALSYLSTLLKSRIEIHIQIVLCPGINDGSNLEKAVRTLESDFSRIKSIGIVPVGLTQFRADLFPLRLFTVKESRNLIQKMKALQKHFYKKRGTSWIFLADEFYLQADEPLPPFTHYEDFPQLENGIGLTRMFLQNIEENLRLLPKLQKPEDSFTIVTGKLAAPIVEKTFDKIQTRLGGIFDIRAIPNHFFGENITVAGLITARDIIDFFKSGKISGTLLIPDVMLDSEEMFLDNISLCELASMLEVPVEKVPVECRSLFEKLALIVGRKK